MYFFVSDRIELGNIANLMLKLEMHGLDKKMTWKKNSTIVLGSRYTRINGL